VREAEDVHFMKADPFFTIDRWRARYGDGHIRFRVMGVTCDLWTPEAWGWSRVFTVRMVRNGVESVYFNRSTLLDAMKSARVFAHGMLLGHAERIESTARDISSKAKQARALRKAGRIRDSARWFGL